MRKEKVGATVTTLNYLCKQALELDEKATKGPWTVSDDYPSFPDSGEAKRYKVLCQDTMYEDPRYQCEVPRYTRKPFQDCDLVATYRSICPEIARRALELQARCEKLEAVAKAATDLRRYCRECSGQENQYYVAEKEFDEAIEALESK